MILTVGKAVHVWKQETYRNSVLSAPPFFLSFVFLSTTPMAYGDSQTRDLMGAVAMPQPQPRQIQAESAAYTTDHGNTRSLTQRARPGIEPQPHGS